MGWCEKGGKDLKLNKMKREIKFRAWLQQTCKMTNDHSIIEWAEILSKTLNSSVDNNIYLQYTGLKDRNGKEIYEGDIVRILYTDWPSNTDPTITLEDYLISISHVGEIAYEAPQFGVMLEDRYGDKSLMNLHIGAHGRLEVIGNRFENPELL